MKRYNDFMELAVERFSCRSYSAKLIEDDTVSKLVEAVRIAPSACNRQPWRLAIVRQDDVVGRKAIATAYPREWIKTAPLYIVVCGQIDEAWVRPCDGLNHMYVDLAIATQQICLAATALGLGTCWICNFDPESLKIDLGLTSDIEPMAIIPVGYPAEDIAIPEKKRKDVDEIVIR